MKKIQSYDDFINEENYYGNYDKITRKVYPNKVHKDNAYYLQSDLDWQLKQAEVPLNYTITKLVRDQEVFGKLSDETQIEISKITGIKRSPNKKFIKDYVAALNKFGQIDRTDYNMEEDALDLAIACKKMLEKERYPDSYAGLDRRDSRKLYKEYGYGSEMFKKLTDEEIAHLQKIIKPQLERCYKQYFTNSNIENLIKKKLTEEFPKDTSNRGRYGQYSDEYEMTGVSFKSELPQFFKFITDLLLAQKSIKWDSFKVIKLDSVGSEQSAVVSSSFSTTYYYSVEFKFMNKTFKNKKFAKGSDYYSGGWN